MVRYRWSVDSFTSLYYPLDLAIGFGVPLVLMVLRLVGRLHRDAWKRFWLGCAVGATWEVPIFAGSCASSTWATIHFLSPPPVPWPLLLLSHTLWDGTLFALGWWLVNRIVSATHRPLAAAALFVLYGQLQALAVEVSSLTSGGWGYHVQWWNPELLQINGQPLTALPHLFWLWGSAVFWWAWRRAALHSA